MGSTLLLFTNEMAINQFSLSGSISKLKAFRPVRTRFINKSESRSHMGQLRRLGSLLCVAGALPGPVPVH